MAARASRHAGEGEDRGSDRYRGATTSRRSKVKHALLSVGIILFSLPAAGEQPASTTAQAQTVCHGIVRQALLSPSTFRVVSSLVVEDADSGSFNIVLRFEGASTRNTLVQDDATCRFAAAGIAPRSVVLSGEALESDEISRLSTLAAQDQTVPHATGR